MIRDSPATRVQPKWKFHDDRVFARKLVRVEMSIALQYFGTHDSHDSIHLLRNLYATYLQTSQKFPEKVAGFDDFPEFSQLVSIWSWDPGYGTRLPFPRHRAWSSTSAIRTTPSSKSSGCLFQALAIDSLGPSKKRWGWKMWGLF